jgi:phosphoglycolate phosphatase-like HAD superfamily hydrolase
MRCYIFDIDGTLADLSHRLHHITGETKDWDAFFAACERDAPIEHMCDVARTLLTHSTIVFASGRSDAVRSQTETWLADRRLYGAVYMRRAGDHRHDDIVKGELIDRIIADGFEPILVFEDRQRVVDMIRKRGIPCAQVAAGDF